MKRFAYLTLAMAAMTFCSQAWLGAVAPAQAATVTDTFEFKATVKQFCQENPKFVNNFNVKVAEGDTLTVTRDVNNDGDLTDIEIKINNSGNADIEAITLNGLAFPRNTSGRQEEFVLSGRNPVNEDHFITARGKGTFDKLGNLTKVTGIFVLQIIDNYPLPSGEDSDPVECISNGTFGTGKKIVLP